MVQMESEMFEGGGVSGLQPSYITQTFDQQKCPDALMQFDFFKQDPNSEAMGIDPSEVENLEKDLDSFFADQSKYPAQEASYSHLYADAEHNFHPSHGLLTITNLQEPSQSNSVKLDSREGNGEQHWVSKSSSILPQQAQALDNIFVTPEETCKVLSDILPISSATPLISVNTEFQVILAFRL